MFSLQSTVAQAAGRDASFTGRTGIWETVLQEPINPLIGTGYSSFWLGERLDEILDDVSKQPSHSSAQRIHRVLYQSGIDRRVFAGVRSLERFEEDAEQNGFFAFHVRRPIEWLRRSPCPMVLRICSTTSPRPHLEGTNFLFVVFLMLACGDPGPSVAKAIASGLTRTPKRDPLAKRRADEETSPINETRAL